MSTTVSYKGETIATVNNNTKTLETEGQYLEADIILTDVSGSATLTTKNITSNGTYNASSDNADGYSSVTVNVSGGGGGVAEKQVNFIDYDGTILYSYTAQEANALTALPSNPSHTGLTAQGWNWTLAEIKARLTANSNDTVNVGQMYTTSDGKTRFYFNIASGRKGVSIRLTPTSKTGATINWGDGTSTISNSTSANDYTHTYTDFGEYVVTVEVTSGSVSFVGSSTEQILGAGTYRYNRPRLLRAEIGNNVTSIGNYAFYYAVGLKSVTIPKTVTSFGNYSFSHCHSLECVVFPKLDSGSISIGGNALDSSYAIQRLSFPDSVSSIGSTSFTGVFYNMTSFTVPKVSSLPSVGNYASFVKTIVFPEGVASIAGSTFSEANSLEKVYLPSTLTSIGTNSFGNSRMLREVHLLSTSPPTFGSNAFVNNNTFTIYVPYSVDHSVLSAYQTASGWSSLSSYMQEEPQ